MEMRSWLQSPSSLTHGNIIRREIFSKKDPDDPHKPGAILNHIDSFSRAILSRESHQYQHLSTIGS